MVTASLRLEGREVEAEEFDDLRPAMRVEPPRPNGEQPNDAGPGAVDCPGTTSPERAPHPPRTFRPAPVAIIKTQRFPCRCRVNMSEWKLPRTLCVFMRALGFEST